MTRRLRAAALLLGPGIALVPQVVLASTGAAELLAACNAAPISSTLQAEQQGLPADARAVWLDARRLYLPAAGRDGRYRLYHSAAGRLSLAVGAAVQGADASVALRVQPGGLPAALAARFGYLGEGEVLALDATAARRLPDFLRGQLLLVQEDAQGLVQEATAIQPAAALDKLYSRAGQARDLGVSLPRAAGQPRQRHTQFKLWAPTAHGVTLCRYAAGQGPAVAAVALRRDAASGIWSLLQSADLSGSYYSYLVEVQVRGVGRVRNRVTDPYAISLTTDSRRAYIADLASPALKPAGWDASEIPARVASNVDMSIYELHVRDFSIDDASVPAPKRGKYQAFGASDSNGMRHLRALAEAGISDVHLLPVFDLATVPEAGCLTPSIPDPAQTGPASEAQQAAVMAVAARDCFNWGYDPLHFNAPEGSFASDPSDGARRVIELREMVLGLHRAGLRVGMDMVYNHTSASGQHPQSVLDRIVPGYYQRYDAKGQVERSTCCDNTATENLMMAKLMSDSVVLWAREYKMASFRFDLMGHQPRDAMVAMQQRLRRELGREVQFIGEGWNFGEVANGARFVQASQLSLNGSGIATFSDRGRDAARGGSAGDGGAAMVSRQGWLSGLHYAPNALGGSASREDLLKAADLVRVGLSGSLRGFALQNHQGQVLPMAQIDYAGQPAGYVVQPGEVVNYVENHDNQTLFDTLALKLPRDTSREDRARVQVLGLALTAFSQGVAYFHAGAEILRSKSLDRNSYDSGDWFNRLDWTLQDNHFGSGLPPTPDNGAHYEFFRPVLADASIKPEPAQIRWTRDAFLDLLRIRASSSLFRLKTAEELQRRLRWHNTGPQQRPTLMAAELDGRGLEGAGFQRLIYFVNAGLGSEQLQLDAARGLPYVLHPVHLAAAAADRRPVEAAAFDSVQGRFSIPPRSALVFVLP